MLYRTAQPSVEQFGDEGIGASVPRCIVELVMQDENQQPPSMAAGDATFHAGWTLHRAAPNTTGKMREVMTVIYFADGACIAPMTTGNAGDLERLFPGLQTGDVAASPLTPLLYTETA